MVRFFFLIITFLFASVFCPAQILSTLHSKNFNLNQDTLSVDSLSLVPGSVHLYSSDGKTIPENLFSIDYVKSIIVFHNRNVSDSNNFTLIYRTFPLDFRQKTFHKNPSLQNSLIQNNNNFVYRVEDPGTNNYFGTDELIKRGSISRGVSFGNNQDVVVNSNLNLQLSGKLGKDLSILAAVTDNNIPIQPEGNTQQIQDFDKVFITLFNETFRLTVGDFEIQKPAGNYMQMNRKVQGLIASNIFTLGKKKNQTFKTTLSGSISKGKYFKMNFNGTEGTQGPYRLKGAYNESYIIIIAGSERLFIDGKQLERGQDQDYIIDYNTAEIIFTAKQPITKDKRIVIEYEYTDKNYARFMLFSANEWNSKNGKVWLNYFTEQDSKNQTLQQNLTENDKFILSQAGDSSELAVVPYYSMDTSFSSNQIYYKMLDTLVSSTLYDSIFVYSTNSDSAIYKVGFSYMGSGKGNYIQIKNAANGRVFKWVAPISNVRQGEYEPVRQLIAPKKKTVITTGAILALLPTLNFKYEFGLSQNDLNTFSTKEDKNNTGFAFKTELEKKFLIGDTLKNHFSAATYFQQVDSKFDPIERFRSTEFERDWNLTTSKNQLNEIMTGLSLKFNRLKIIQICYGIDYMNREKIFDGLRHNVILNSEWKGFQLKGNGSYLQSNEAYKQTNFLRNKISLQKNIKQWYAGVSEEQEINTWKNPTSDSLYANSFRYDQWELFAGRNDTLKNPMLVSYRQRKDFLPNSTSLKYATKSREMQLSTAFTKNPKNVLKADITYRILDIIDTNLTTSAQEENLTGRLEHALKVYKSVLFINTIYETGSGLEPKKEFVYLEVPAGQGVYTWSDYNGNGIKELNEFETAMFSDQATYIRVYTPTNEYIKVYNSKLTQVINLRPETVWGNKKGIRKLVSRFSDQLAYSFDNKHSSQIITDRIDPFPGMIADSSSLAENKNVRNTLSFNKTNSVFGIDYQYQENAGSLLLVNGTDVRSLLNHTIKIRWNISNTIGVMSSASKGDKSYTSEYFPTKNYKLDIKTIEASLNFQPSVSLRFTGSGKLVQKTNLSGNENANTTGAGLEVRYTVVQKGDLSLKADYIKIHYNGESSSSVGYEILEGLLPGNNCVWSAQYQRDISNSLQISVSYNGRISQDSKAVHIGTIQMRAYF